MNTLSQDLYQFLVQHIQGTPQQRIPFADYMYWVLYHPELGYYNNPTDSIGMTGDFFTSPHLGTDFAELLADCFWQMWQRLDCPDSFDLIELGAGQGLIAQDVLNYLQQQHSDFFATLNYHILEQSPLFLKSQRNYLHTWQAAGKLRWLTWDDLEANSVVGCFFSNEFFDALPVHRLCWHQEQWQEIYVAVSSPNQDSPFTEVLDQLSDRRLADYFDLVSINPREQHYSDRYCTEVNLQTVEFMARIAQSLKRGFTLTLDYGYPARQYYHPQRNQGTLQCYYHHRRHHDPYCYLGQQDITAHVDMTALERTGQATGLQTCLLTQQGLFLMALGLGDRLAANNQNSQGSVMETLQRREALHQLINPLGLGGFYVLLQGKEAEISFDEQNLPKVG